MANVEGAYHKSDIILRTLCELFKLIFITTIWDKYYYFPNILNGKTSRVLRSKKTERLNNLLKVKECWTMEEPIGMLLSASNRITAIKVVHGRT